MSESSLSPLFQPTVSRNDWIALINMLTMYQHNVEFRALQGRMLEEARRAGFLMPDSTRPEHTASA